MEVPNNRGQNLNLKRFLLMDIGYQMKMQLRKILILPAVDDQPIGGELKIIHKALDCGIQVRKKGGICCIKFLQGSDGFLRHQQNMEWIRWLRMVERDQRPCFTQACYRDGKTQMCKDPADPWREQPEQSAHQIITN